MNAPFPASCTAFDGFRLIASGSFLDVALATKRAIDAGAPGPVMIFDDRTSRQVEIDFRGTPDDVKARLQPASAEPVPRGPGRPKLGVVAREVTLLPRHWDWLSSQPGGASATIRRLVDEARRGNSNGESSRQASEAVDRFMQAIAGDLRGFEEASRAFWRGERDGFHTLIDHWPSDVRNHLKNLASSAWDTAEERT
ncbi:MULTISPECIES: DUF2239 family protein [Dyella]|uniref:DUF2239 family protein n=2 Tax=Dyella TaxID=231454 RepID=A0A4R0YJ74_9GAMM|nr:MULTISPECIES: DUF2239 family protein [Dyella]TBR35941.1 DUF2239 family protein [Dyella terrae]TCI08512.1 DUF2239 family protein [Dyella soli]